MKGGAVVDRNEPLLPVTDELHHQHLGRGKARDAAPFITPPEYLKRILGFIGFVIQQCSQNLRKICCLNHHSLYVYFDPVEFLFKPFDCNIKRQHITPTCFLFSESINGNIYAPIVA